MSDRFVPDTGVRNRYPQVALEAHARELTMLEAAVLVLSPSLHDADLLAYNEGLERLHERVNGISSLIGDLEDLDAVAEQAAAEFSELGSGLNDLLREIRVRIRDTDIALIRMSADKLCETRRSDVEALLDMCLCDIEELDELWPLTDLLIARLATGREKGERVMVRDPSRLTPRLSQVCLHTAEQQGEDAEASLHFYGAISELDKARDLDEIERIIARHYKFKESLGRKRLLPGVLRSSVLYSTAVSNRIEALAEEDEELVTSADFVLVDRDAPPTLRLLVQRPWEPTEPEVAPLAEHAGFQAIRAALRTRLASCTCRPGPVWTIAAGADLSKLEEADREALCADEESLATPGLSAMLVVALMVAQRPHIDGELAALEIDPDLLEDHWVPEVRGTLRAQIRDLILTGRYDESRGPAEALTRLLPVWATSEFARRARAVVLPQISLDGLDLRSLLAKPKQGKLRSRLVERPLLAAALALVAIVLVGRVMAGPPGSVHLLDREELNAISPHLTAAQRDQLGYGSAMFAKIDADWDSHDQQEQYQRALEIARRLRADGVHNVVISDERKRMRIQIQGGKLQYPERPE